MKELKRLPGFKQQRILRIVRHKEHQKINYKIQQIQTGR